MAKVIVSSLHVIFKQAKINTYNNSKEYKIRLATFFHSETIQPREANKLSQTISNHAGKKSYN